MNKENILFAVVGLLIGLIGGFIFANNYNRNAITTAQVTSSPSSNQPSAPFAATGNQTSSAAVKDQSSGGNPPTAAMPGVQAALDKAKNEPENFDAQMEVGKMFYRIQNFEQAAKYFEKANQIQPENYEAVTMVGNAYFDGGKYELAEKWYSTALAKKPDDVSVRTDLGLTFFLRQPPNVERAIQEYRKSLQINPNHELTLQNLAVALQQKGDTQGFNETLEQLKKVNPNNPALQKLNGQ